MKIKDLSRVDMPREKLAKYGTKKLKDYELLAVLLGSGIQGMNVLELSKRVLQKVHVIGIQKITLKDMQGIKGLGSAKAAQVCALIELGNRLSNEQEIKILSGKDVWNMCSDIRDSKKEHVVVFYLDTQHNILDRRIVSVGIVNMSLVHPREVFEPAIALGASSILLAHNHPSGEVEPSREDKRVTQRLLDAAKILDIELKDHVIVSKNSYRSFRQEFLI